MNKHILKTMDILANPDKYTQAEKDENKKSAYAANAAAYPAAANAAAYPTAYAYAAAAYAAGDVDSTEKWISKYFERSGDNKQEYIDALNGTASDDKLIYTKEMADNNIVPLVGMEFISTEFSQQRHSIVKAITNEYIIYVCADPQHLSECCIEICANHHHPVTPPIELIDGNAYQFEYDNKVKKGIYRDTFNPYFCGGYEDYKVDGCTNIKPLKVES